MYNKEEILLLLKCIAGLGDATIRKLILVNAFDNKKIKNEEDIYLFLKAHSYCFQKKDLITKIDIAHIKAAEIRMQKILVESKANDTGYITYYSNAYPKRFKDMANSSAHDFPIVIYYKGDINLLNSDKTCAVIGSREASPKAIKICTQLTKQMVKRGYVIVSGLAKGCDSVAHRSCIDAKGKTIAIVGTGLNIIYPKENESLFNEILDSGGLIISEYPIGFKVTAYSFVQRDRLQASLSDIVIPIQTSIDGGTMHACKFSTTYNKKLWVISPSVIDDADTSGNAYLLKAYFAKEITDINSF